MPVAAIAIVLVLLLILIYVIWRVTRTDHVKEQYTIARAKLDRARAYDGYQNHLLDKYLSEQAVQRKSGLVTPDDQAKLISLREMAPTMTQLVDDLGGALVKIYSHANGPDALDHRDIVERIVLVNSALDRLWLLQCEQNKRLARLSA